MSGSPLETKKIEQLSLTFEPIELIQLNETSTVEPR